MQGDRLSITGESRDLRKFFVTIGQYKKPVKRTMIVGGGRTTVYLVRMLRENNIDVTVIERDRQVCEKLCDQIPEAHIVCGNATHSDVLQEDGISDVDAFVSLTGDDGDNIITSLYAKSCKVDKVITKVNSEHFADILLDSGLESIVSPKKIVAEQLARYVRAISNSVGSSMETLYRLVDGKVEVLEFRVEDDSKCIGIPLKDLKLKENILIGAVIRGKKSIIPNGLTEIMAGDHAIVVAASGHLQRLFWKCVHELSYDCPCTGLNPADLRWPDGIAGTCWAVLWGVHAAVFEKYSCLCCTGMLIDSNPPES